MDIHWINDQVSFSIPVRDDIKWGQKEEIWVLDKTTVCFFDCFWFFSQIRQILHRTESCMSHSYIKPGAAFAIACLEECAPQMLLDNCQICKFQSNLSQLNKPLYFSFQITESLTLFSSFTITSLAAMERDGSLIRSNQYYIFSWPYIWIITLPSSYFEFDAILYEHWSLFGWSTTALLTLMYPGNGDSQLCIIHIKTLQGEVELCLYIVRSCSVCSVG